MNRLDCIRAQIRILTVRLVRLGDELEHSEQRRCELARSFDLPMWSQAAAIAARIRHEDKLRKDADRVNRSIVDLEQWLRQEQGFMCVKGNSF